MKNSSTIRPMGICAAMVTASLLAACGGGGSSSSAVADAVGATVSGTQPGTASSESTGAGTGTNTSTPITDTTAPDLSTRPTPNTALSTTQYAEALATTADTKTMTSALASVGSDLTSVADSSMTTIPPSNDNTVDFAAGFLTGGGDAGNAVSTLATSSSIGKYVKYTDEGHSFTVPTNTQLRFGDPATNRWVTKTVSGYGECTNTFFRNDPAYQTPKVCQVWAPTAAMAAAASGPSYVKPAGLMPTIDLTKIPTPWIGFDKLMVQPTTEVAWASDIGQFRTACGVAKLAFDDPIVFPGQSGKAHLHTFFGNTGVNASSTPESLRNTGGSTCRGGIANRSAYWVPTMIDTRNGTPLLATGNGVYYKTGYELPQSSIRPIPAGLRMIAGNPGATTAGSEGYRFKCVGGPNNENDKYGSQIGNCDAGASLIQEIMFPQCWDGVNLDAPDHKSHMSYPVNNACPASHPVALPAISFNVEYVVSKKDDPLYWRLSSDNYNNKLPGGYSSHGDWFNGWNTEISDSWAKNCVMAVKDCHSHLLGDGRMVY